jgi:uncharacterized membrane protein (UPF0127 family)
MAALVLGVACSRGDEAPPATPTETTESATSKATPSGSATGNAELSPSATPHVVVTASPDEPVASTAFVPASELPEAVMTGADGTRSVLPIEVPARTEYNIGLSGRLELGERGMLFWYAVPTTQSFWMRNTHYDLSIAFVDGDGTILEILMMEADSLQPHQPEQAYRYAIEAPAGWFAGRGLGAGDQALLDFEIPDSVRQ